MAKDKYKSSTKITYIRDKVLPPPKKAQPISESTEKEREREASKCHNPKNIDIILKISRGFLTFFYFISYHI